ncbi:MAG: UvrD-helicase domain-containing protein [Patescibacteria group bacterium]
MSDEQILKDLNQNQIEAVKAVEGPVLIIAGPGSGKTATLTRRVAYMISIEIKPENILCITFTNKAAQEMKERIQNLLGRLTATPLVGTFHSICAKILRNEAKILGFTKNFTIYDGEDQLSLIKKTMETLGFSQKNFNPYSILNRISKLKSGLAYSESYDFSDGNYYEKIVGQIYNAYQKELKTANAMDFDDLIMLTVELFEKNPQILKKYQSQFKYLLVDECLPYNTPILLADGSKKVIGDIVKNKESLPVLTYNLKTRQQELKKIVGWKEIPAKGKRFYKIVVAKRCHKRNRYKTKYKKSTIRTLFCTDNHKIFANGKFVKTAELKVGDRLQWESSFTKPNMKFCNKCKKIFQTYKLHEARHEAFKRKNCELCGVVYKSRFQLKIHLEKHKNPEFKRNYSLSPAGLSVLQNRMLTDNPMNYPEIKAKAGKSRSDFWKNLSPQERDEKLQRFINLPVFSYYKPPTKPEKIIQSFGFNDLIYSGKGKVWVTFKNGQHKCPDFILKNQRKVIEVADLEYWHTEEEMNLLKNRYSQIGFKTLILDAKEVVDSPDEIKKEIQKFIEDCPTEVEIIDIEKLKNVNEKFVYDIEVEDNHNFYANGILVHNCQDTNIAQYHFAKLLAQKYRNIFTVGDVDQSIYMWRSADFRNMLNFEKDFPEAKIIRLEQNYRSTKAILAAGQGLIQNNIYRHQKGLWTENSEGEKISIAQLDDEKEESRFIIEKMKKLIQKGYKLKDFVILYRTHAQSRPIEEEFLTQGFPYKIIGALKFYERKEIKDILAYLRILANPNDFVSLQRIYNVPTRGIGKASFVRFADFMRKNKLNLSDALLKAKEIKELPTKARFSLYSFGKTLEKMKEKAKDYGLTKLIKFIVSEIGYKEYLDTKSEEGYMRWENVKELLTVAKKHDKLKTNEAMNKFLEEVALIQETDPIRARTSNGAGNLDEIDKVQLMTLHSAKGLEFPIVFLVGAEEGLLPHSKSLSNPIELEEERRLCYVGITRAKRRVFITLARSRNIFGTSSQGISSRFLDEIPKEVVELNSDFDSFDEKRITDYI